MAIEHNTIADGERHEPKGIASAANGTVYVANGAGAGMWKPPGAGFEYHQHGTTGQVINTTAALLQCNGGGGLTSTAHTAPHYVIDGQAMWDSTNYHFNFTEIGDVNSIRVDIPVTAESGSPTEMTFQFDISGAGSPTTVILERYAGTGKVTPYTISFSMPLSCLAAGVVTNGIQLFVKTDSGTCTLGAPGIHVVSLNSGGYV